MAVAPGAVGHVTQEAPSPLARSRARHPLALFLLRRVATGLLSLLVVSMLIFVATNVLPGNAAVVVLGRSATPERVHKLEREIGISGSVPERYLRWLGDAVQGDFGKSAIAAGEGRTQTSVSATLGDPLRNSLILAAITALLLIPVTLLFGAIAGIFAGRKLDHAVSIPALVFGGLPEFVTGTLLIYVFFSKLGALPPVSLVASGASPLDKPEILVLPVFTLLAVASGAGIRQVRAGMVEVMQQDYVRFARLNGVSEHRVLLGYALRNALAPSVQIVAQNLQYLVGGIIIVESVYAYPGVGTFLINAVTARDVIEVQAAAMVLATVYIGINVVADLIVVLLVPKLRTGLR